MLGEGAPNTAEKAEKGPDTFFLKMYPAPFFGPLFLVHTTTGSIRHHAVEAFGDLRQSFHHAQVSG